VPEHLEVSALFLSVHFKEIWIHMNISLNV